MKFAIQTGSPRVLVPADRSYVDLTHALQFMFPLATEDAMLLWNHVPVRLSYKYDLSIIIEDLVALLQNLLSRDEGHELVSWPSDTFMSHWDTRWRDGVVTIDAKWTGVAGGYEALLNTRATVEVPLTSFLSEWRGVLAVISRAVDRSGITLQNKSTLQQVREVISASPTRGQLYLPVDIQARDALRDLDLDGADLQRADLSGLRGDGLDLRRADLSEAILHGVHFVDCRLQRAVLERADFNKATLRACHLEGARAQGVHLSSATLEASFAVGAEFDGADLSGAHLSETSFARATLRGVKLDGAEGSGVDLRGADLVGASLVGAQFDDADFRGADLSGADLSRGNFEFADFRGAILDDVRWTEASWARALFDVATSPILAP